MNQSEQRRVAGPVRWACALAASFALCGCTADYSGQSLPSPYYLSDDIQYFPPGPEFKLTREAAAQKEYRETQAQREGVPPQ